MSERALTTGEMALAKRVFKDSLDYGKIKIHNEKYKFFQPNESGMTPAGEIYIAGTQTYQADYSLARVRLRAFFIHEMTHVWQYQLNILNPVTAAIGESILNIFDYDKAYNYELIPTKDLLKYRIEQQAQIVEDYYLWHLEAVPPARKRATNSGSSSSYVPIYLQVLAGFLSNPGYARHITVRNRETYGPPSSRHVTCTRVLAP